MKRCGSLCWTAQEPKCECICGGLYHSRAGEARRAVVKALCGFLPKTERDMEHVRTVLAYKLQKQAQLNRAEYRRLGV